MKRFSILIPLVLVVIALTLGFAVNWNFVTIKVKTNLWAGSYVAGQDTFTTSSLVDTLAFTPGVVKSTDIFLVNMVGDTTDIAPTVKTDTLIVKRKGGGNNGAKYSYFRIVPK